MNNKGIHIKAIDTELYIPIYDKVTVITGDSATGKTKMLNFLKECKNASRNQIEVKSTINLEDIIIVDDNYFLDIIIEKQEKSKTIFIDRANLLINDNVLNFMNKSNNVFILIGHGNVSKLASQDAVLSLKHDGKKYVCTKMYPNGILKPLEKI